MSDEAVLRIVVQDEGGVNPDASSVDQDTAPPPASLSSAYQSSPQPHFYQPQAQPTAPQSSARAPSTPSVIFDPAEEARKMRESEVRREQIKLAYEEMYENSSRASKTFDTIVDVATKMRGTLGGAFGPMAGAVLDVIAAVKAIKPEDTSVRREAQRRNDELKEYQANEPADVQTPAFNQRSINPPVVQAVDDSTPATLPAPKASVSTDVQASVKQSQAVLDMAAEALRAVGHTRLEADNMLKTLLQGTTQTFNDVGEVLQAISNRDKQSPDAKEKNIPADRSATPVQNLNTDKSQPPLAKSANLLPKVELPSKSTVQPAAKEAILANEPARTEKEPESEWEFNLPAGQADNKSFIGTDDLNSMGSGASGAIVANMYNAMYSRYQKKETTEAGIPFPSPFLQAADYIRKAGRDLSLPEFTAMAQEMAAVTAKGSERSSQFGAIVNKWTQKKKKESPPTPVVNDLLAAASTPASATPAGNQTGEQKDEWAYYPPAVEYRAPKKAKDDNDMSAMFDGGSDGLARGMYTLMYKRLQAGKMNEQDDFPVSPYLQAGHIVQNAGRALSDDDFWKLAKEMAKVTSTGPERNKEFNAIVNKWTERKKQDNQNPPVPNASAQAAATPTQAVAQNAMPKQQNIQPAITVVTPAPTPPVAQAAPPVAQAAQAAPPVAQAAPPVAQAAQAAPPVAQAAPPVAQAAPPVATIAPPIARAAPPVAIAAPPVARPVPPVAPSMANTASAASPGVSNAAATAGGSSMAGMAGMASMASQIAGPAAVAMAGLEVLKAVRDTSMSAVRAIGDVATAAANPDADAAGSVAMLGDGVKAVSDKLFYISPVVGIFGSVVGEATTSVAKFMGAVNATAARYGEYSPQIAQAQAIAEINQTMGDLRRAQSAGPELARYLQVQGELQQKFEDTKIKILTKILPLVTAIMRLAEGLSPAVDTIGAGIDALATPVTVTAALLEQIRNMFSDATQPPPLDPTDMIFANPNNQAPGVVGPPTQNQGQGVQVPQL